MTELTDKALKTYENGAALLFSTREIKALKTQGTSRFR